MLLLGCCCDSLLRLVVARLAVECTRRLLLVVLGIVFRCPVFGGAGVHELSLLAESIQWPSTITRLDDTQTEQPIRRRPTIQQSNSRNFPKLSLAHARNSRRLFSLAQRFALESCVCVFASVFLSACLFLCGCAVALTCLRRVLPASSAANSDSLTVCLAGLLQSRRCLFQLETLNARCT